MPVIILVFFLFFSRNVLIVSLFYPIGNLFYMLAKFYTLFSMFNWLAQIHLSNIDFGFISHVALLTISGIENLVIYE